MALSARVPRAWIVLRLRHRFRVPGSAPLNFPHAVARPMRFLAPITLAASVVLGIPAMAQQSARPSDRAVLSPGDSVRIVVWRRPEFSGDFVVAPDGSITHPLYRAVKVGGVPFTAAETNLRTFLGRFEESPQFVMEPLIRVAISGEVGRPQVFALRPETTIGEAVARAGGTTREGDRNRIRVLRVDPDGRQHLLVVSLADPQGGYGKLPVQSGDQIVVDRRKSFMRDILLPGLGLIGSIASVGLLIDRINR